MKNLTLASLFALGLVSCGLTGCSETTAIRSEKTTETPTGTSTTTTETEVKQTGENPPPAP